MAVSASEKQAVIGELEAVEAAVAGLRLEVQALPVETSPPPDPDPVPTGRQPFRVQGRKVLNPVGGEFVPMGCNGLEFWGATYLPEYSPVGLPDLRRRSIAHMDDAGVNMVRIVTATGIGGRANWAWNQHPTVHRELVDALIARGIVPVLEMHDSTIGNQPGGDNPRGLMRPEVRQYWYSPEVIGMCIACPEMWVNLSNEANFELPPDAQGNRLADYAGWRDWYIETVQHLRQHGVKNIITIDTGNRYAQNPLHILQGGYAAEIQVADPLHNCVFSVHMYQYWEDDDAQVQNWPEGQWDPDVVLPQLAAVSVPVIVGEFGFGPDTNNVRYKGQQLFLQAESLGIGTLVWSWSDNAEFRLVNNLVSYPQGAAGWTPAGDFFIPYWRERRISRSGLPRPAMPAPWGPL